MSNPDLYASSSETARRGIVADAVRTARLRLVDLRMTEPERVEEALAELATPKVIRAASVLADRER